MQSGSIGSRAIAPDPADVILILNLNLVDQEIAAAETASKAEFCAAAVQGRTCLLSVKKTLWRLFDPARQDLK
jgi:hypothetical protein